MYSYAPIDRHLQGIKCNGIENFASIKPTINNQFICACCLYRELFAVRSDDAASGCALKVRYISLMPRFPAVPLLIIFA